MSETDYTISPLGFLHSPLKSREAAPNQGSEGAPDAWLEIDEAFAEGLEGIMVGDEILLFPIQSVSFLLICSSMLIPLGDHLYPA